MFLVIILLFLAQPGNISATSGACSYHSGVNCSVGPSYTGNVTCNDGWVNSSVKYYDTDECKVVDTCPGIIYGLVCTSESDYARVQEQVDGIRGRQRAMLSNTGMIGSGSDNSKTIGQDQLDSCRKAIGLYNAMVTSREQCLNGQQQQYIQQSKKDRQSQCSVLHGNPSFYNENKARCECREGYAPDSSATFQCVSMNQFCQDSLGPNSLKSTSVYEDEAPLLSMCSCANGYIVDLSGVCGKQVKPTRLISIIAKSWADNAGGPCANSAMSADEKRECVDYQLHKDGYEWITYDPQKNDSLAPEYVGSFDPLKFGATPVEQPKKTLTLSEVRAKSPKTNSVATTTTSPKQILIKPSATSSQSKASSTPLKPPQKQTAIEKLRGFFFKWWR